MRSPLSRTTPGHRTRTRKTRHGGGLPVWTSPNLSFIDAAPASAAFAWVAQLVEQRIENPRVGGSNPPPGTIPFSNDLAARLRRVASWSSWMARAKLPLPGSRVARRAATARRAGREGPRSSAPLPLQLSANPPKAGQVLYAAPKSRFRENVAMQHVKYPRR